MKYIIIFLLSISINSELLSKEQGVDLKSTGHKLYFKMKENSKFKIVSHLIFKNIKTKKKNVINVDNFAGINLKSEIPFAVIDLNSDGYQDIYLLLEGRAYNADYLYILYSTTQKKYISLGVFPRLNIDDKKLLFSEEKISKDEIEYKNYKIIKDKIIEISSTIEGIN